MGNKKPSGLVLPPPYILSDDFIKKIKPYEDYLDMDISEDVWLRAVIANVSKFEIPSEDYLKFCKSIKGLYLGGVYNLQEWIFNDMLYLESLSEMPRALFDEDFLNSLCRKYHYFGSPYIALKVKKGDVYVINHYLLLYDYVLPSD